MINLIATQEQIMKQIFCYGTSKAESSAKQGGDESDEDEEIEVGDGCFIPRSLFTFKVLVFDTSSQNIVAPIMKVGKLRDCNILLHQNITQSRERVPDLPAIYLIEPTTENFKKLAADANKNLYDFLLISFTRPLSQGQMENFAAELVKVNVTHKVLRVTQEYLGGYQVISPDFFVLPGGQ